MKYVFSFSKSLFSHNLTQMNISANEWYFSCTYVDKDFNIFFLTQKRKIVVKFLVILFSNGMHVFLQCGPCQTTMLPTVLEFSAIKYVLSVDKPNEFYDLEVIF